MTASLAKKVLVIGWDAADWKVIHPLLEKGWMPNLKRFMEEGVHGNIATLYPVLSPMLWTSIATGKRPYKHGIHGFSEPDPHSGGIRPITNLSRKTKAVWNILNQHGKKANVIGWWPSHPAEPINGLMVSNHFQRATAPLGKPWPMQPGTTNRMDLAEHLKELRIHPAELDESHILPFIPNAAKIDQKKDRRLESLAKIIADCTSVHAVATAAMQLEEWDFMAVYYDAIDHFCHAFMKYHPPRQEHIPEEDFEMYRDCVVGGYRYHDMLLGVLLALAGPETTVILMSDHGFHPDHLRPKSVPIEPAGPAAEHRHYGIFVMKGPNVRKGEQVFGASVLDLCPTVLNCFGLPVGQDMDGKPLVSVYEETPEVESIPTWDEVDGPEPDGCHPADKTLDPVEAKEAIDQLVALGYIEKPDDNKEVAVSETVRELQYNLARAYMDGGIHAEAVPLLETIWEKWPEEHRFGVQLINCYLALGQTKRAGEVLDLTIQHKQEFAKIAREKLKEFQEQNKEKERKPEDFTEKERRELRRWQAQAAFNPFAMAYLRATILHAEGDDEKALAALKAAEKADARQPGLHLKIGEVYLKLTRWKDAEEFFQKALDIDPENSAAHVGFARAYLPQRRNLEAASEALAAVNLIYHNPRAHYLLGVALHRCGRVNAAVDALRVALAQNPNFPEAHKRLAFIYEKRVKKPELAQQHKDAALEARKRIRELKKRRKDAKLPIAKPAQATSSRKPELVSTNITDAPTGPEVITVVSGLPRTGTSMMMQMLDAGGLPPLTDGNREADLDNPKGYYEYDKAKNLAKDRSWLPDAKGKVVKLVAQLLPALPPAPGVTKEEAKQEGFTPPAPYQYRVVFMDRDLDEVLASQKTMLERQDKKGASLADDKLKGVFIQQLERVAQLMQMRKIAVLYVKHNECMANPRATAEQINQFLGGQLDVDAMAAVVDPSLHRQRKD